jgi:Fic family protein
LVLDGEFVPNKPGREYFAARGSADGMAYYKKALVEGKTLTEDLIKDIHERTTLDAQPAARGVYRRSPVYIRGSETVPANWTEVRGLIESLVACWQLSKLHPLYKATAFHALFEAIHPFYDGNGRTGRLLLNYMLEEAGYPPIAVKTDNRKEYLEALEEWQTSEKHDRLIDLINENVLSELNERICCISAARVESDKQPVKQHDGLSLTITDKKIATSKEKPAAQ